MFIDWVSLLLINAMFGYFLLAAFVYRGLGELDHAKWAPGFLMVGVISLVFGGVMVIQWPLPGPFNSAFGEMSVLLGVIFLGAGVAMTKGWSLATVTWYGFFAGLAAIVIGARIILLKLTAAPIPSGGAIILSGLAGVLSPLGWYARSDKRLRVLGMLLLIAIGFIWANVTYRAYWGHMQTLEKWMPPSMRQAAPAPTPHPR
jgi:putative membrane protein